MSAYLRPDEKSANAQVRRAETAQNALNSGVSAIAGAYGLSQVMPFLSEYVPENLAFKGISKVFPPLGKFLKQGMEEGLTLKSGLDYVRGEASKEQAKESKNIIEQYSPELHQFIQEQIKKGISPLQAGAIAQAGIKGKNFESAIKKMVKDHKTDFSTILQTIYGQGQQAQQQAPQQQQQAPIQQQVQGQPQQGQQGNAKWDQIANTLQTLLKS